MSEILTAIFSFFGFVREIYIEIHKIGFEFLSQTSFVYRYDGLVGAILNVVVSILAIVMALFFDILIIWLLYCITKRIFINIRTKEIKYSNVIGEVYNKEYHPAYTTMITNTVGKVTTLTPQHHPEQFIVEVKYRYLEASFDSEELYNDYNINDNIDLILVKRLDKNDQIIDETLELPE